MPGPSLKPGEALIAATFAVASVVSIFSMHCPNLSDVRADGANNDNTRRSTMSAILTSIAVVSGIALLGKSPEVYVVGGLTIAVEGFQYAHANTLSREHGKVTTDVEGSG
jgi:hypothetical protein